jgi:hypothetical protein
MIREEGGGIALDFGRRYTPARREVMAPTLILLCVPPAAAQTVPAHWHQSQLVLEAPAGGIAKLA